MSVSSLSLLLYVRSMRPRPGKKPQTESAKNIQSAIALTCAVCEKLERRYDDSVLHIKEVLELRLPSIRGKIFELHKAQEYRDETIEALYLHRRSHRLRMRRARDQKAA
jgi:hypothetical protein